MLHSEMTTKSEIKPPYSVWFSSDQPYTSICNPRGVFWVYTYTDNGAKWTTT